MQNNRKPLCVKHNEPEASETLYCSSKVSIRYHRQRQSHRNKTDQIRRCPRQAHIRWNEHIRYLYRRQRLRTFGAEGRQLGNLDISKLHVHRFHYEHSGEKASFYSLIQTVYVISVFGYS